MLLPQTKKIFPLPSLALLLPLLSPSFLSLPLVHADIVAVDFIGFASEPLPRVVRSISCIAVCMLLRILSLTPTSRNSDHP